MATQRRGGIAGPYRGRLGGVQPVFEAFKPVSEWSQDDNTHFLIIQVPGFMKEQLRVSTEGRNIIRVRGEHLAAGNKWLRFQEDFQVPENSELTSVRAKHEGGTLTITVPKKDAAGKTLATKKEPSQETPGPSHKVQDPVPPKTADTKTLREPEPDQRARENATPSRTRKPVTDDKSLEPTPETRKATGGELRMKFGQLEEQIPERTEKAVAPENIADKAGKNFVDENTGDKSLDLLGIKKTSGDHLSTRTGQDNGKKSYIDKKGSQEAKEKPVIPLWKDNMGKGKEITEVEDHKVRSSDKESKGNETVKSSAADDSPDQGAFKLELKKYKKRAVQGIGELNEERQLLMNMGAALIVIVALSAYVSYNFASRNAK